MIFFNFCKIKVINKNLCTYIIVEIKEVFMSNFDLYKDIATRTNGDIYIGVVGPVRTGKSTFIQKFMEEVVLDNIDENAKSRAIDELPQSANGKTIMTTEPKFVPAEAVKVNFNDKLSCKVRVIDCVGYIVDGAIGDKENGEDRLVNTPWSEEKIPFSKAGEIGTKKVITEHSTIGVLVTTDGSISDIPRENYVSSEKRVVNELKSMNKPFVILLNCKEINDEVLSLRNELSSSYDAPVIVKNVLELNKEDINEIMEEIVYEFPVKEIDVNIPRWLQVLDINNPIISDIMDRLREKFDSVVKMNDIKGMEDCFTSSNYIKDINYDVDMGTGVVTVNLVPQQDLFYNVLSKECDREITDDFELVNYLRYLSSIEKVYSNLKTAIDGVENGGYGIVYPNQDTIEITEPTIIKKGGSYGIKLKAKANSLHMLNIPIEAEVSPIVGDEKQAKELLETMLDQYKNDRTALLETNLFGKSLDELMKDGIEDKLNNMPDEVKVKMKKTLSRIINESKGGVICILL